MSANWSGGCPVGHGGRNQVSWVLDLTGGLSAVPQWATDSSLSVLISKKEKSQTFLVYIMRTGMGLSKGLSDPSANCQMLCTCLEHYWKENIFCVITTYPSFSENIPLQKKWYLSLKSLEIISLPLGIWVGMSYNQFSHVLEYQPFQCDCALPSGWGQGWEGALPRGWGHRFQSLYQNGYEFQFATCKQGAVGKYLILSHFQGPHR